MIAIKRLASIMWILVVAIASLAAYLISLRVATEQKAVNDLQRDIYRTRASIRYLEAEFGTRASLVQLERWNAADLKLAVTSRDRFLPGETALASLEGIKPNGQAYVPPPVMTAMVVKPADTPAAAATRGASPAPSQVRTEFSLIRSAMANDNVGALPKVGSVQVKPAEAVRAPSPVAKKAARMALLDDKLLDDAALRRLSRGAADVSDEPGAKGAQ